MKKIFYSMLVTLMTAFAFTSCEDVPEPYDDPNGNGGDTPEIPEGTYFQESFAKSLGDFEAKTIKGTPWEYESRNGGYAVGTGYNSSTKETTESEAYLVSPAIDLSSAKEASISFDYIFRYNRDGAVNKVYITDNYTGDPTSTKWTDITGTLTEGSDWTTWYNYAKNVPTQFIGKSNIVIAFYYACGSSSATFELKNLVIKEGKVDETPVTPPSEGEGEGTEESPYDVTAALAKASAENVYVKGFIVGYVDGMSIDEGAKFTGDNVTSQTNILIAQSASETDVKKCIPVQLPYGEVRTGLNLKDNADNYKKEVVLYGNLEKYFGVTGLKSVSYAKIDGKELGKKPSGGDEPTTGEYALGESVAAKDITEGTYAIGYTYEGTNYLMKHEVYSSYYVAAEAYKGSVSNECVFTLKKSGNGFTIKGYDGKYIGVSINGTHTNLVPTEADGSTVWTFADAPSNEHDMTNDCKVTSNKSSNKFLIFSWYSKTNTAEYTMGTYSSQYVNRHPVFYKVTKK